MAALSADDTVRQARPAKSINPPTNEHLIPFEISNERLRLPH
jgi:hypothetical protein